MSEPAMGLRARLLSQPLAGLLTSAVAVAIVAACWLNAPPRLPTVGAAEETGILAVLLVGALYLAQQFPVHIRYTTKIYMASVPLYLMVVLLPPPVAATTVGVGVVVSELTIIKRTRNLYSDIASQAGRWMLVALVGSLISHAPVHGHAPYMAWQFLAAVVLLTGDMVTSPLVVGPVTGERPWHIIVQTTRGVGLPEAGQYGLGLIGAFLAMQDVWASSLLLLPIALLYRVSKRAKEMHETTRLLLENMADSVDQRDTFTHHHSVRVTEWTQALLQELGIYGPEAQLIVTAARVHDIGKIAIPDLILHKHEQLTAQEWMVMETHPGVGAQMLQRYPAFARGAGIVQSHHERWDGRGYPDQLGGTDIPIGARIIAVVDSFDAMISDRPYRKGMPVERAMAILKAGRGTQWDPHVVDAFLHLAEQRYGTPVADVAVLAAVVGQAPLSIS